MPLIGVIAKECDSNFIKNEIIRNSINNKFEVFNINEKNIQNIKNITFESIIINEDIRDLIKYSKYLEDIIKKSKYIVINSDIIKDITMLRNSQINVITYGLNNQATITISSVKDDDILICIQKKFINIKKQDIEEQEINIKIVKNNLKKLCNTLAIFTILSIYGESLQKI